MAQKEMEKNKRPYLIIDRMTGEQGSYVIVFKQDSLFLVCSDKNDEFIPLDTGIKPENVSKEALMICSEQGQK